MLIHETPDRLLIRDSPGCSWAVGGALIPVGLLAVVGAVGLFQGGGLPVPWIRHLTVAAGVCAMAGGACVVLRSPISTLEIDRAAGEVSLGPRGIRSRQGGVWRLDEIQGAALAEEGTGEGSSLCRVDLILAGGERIPISRVWSADRTLCERARDAIERILRATHPVQPSPLDNPRVRLRM